MAFMQGGGGNRPRYSGGAITAPTTTTRAPSTAGITGVTATPRGSSYGGGGGGGGYGSTSSGYIAPYIAPSPPPALPDLESFLNSDSTYQTQEGALKKAYADYLAQQGQAKTNYETSYIADADTLKKNRIQSLADLENDYASRGLITSGLYADSLAKTTNDFDKRQSALEDAKRMFLEAQTNDLTNFSTQQGLTRERARQEAAARRSSLYGG